MEETNKAEGQVTEVMDLEQAMAMNDEDKGKVEADKEPQNPENNVVMKDEGADVGGTGEAASGNTEIKDGEKQEAKPNEENQTKEIEKAF